MCCLNAEKLDAVFEREALKLVSRSKAVLRTEVLLCAFLRSSVSRADPTERKRKSDAVEKYIFNLAHYFSMLSGYACPLRRIPYAQFCQNLEEEADLLQKFSDFRGKGQARRIGHEKRRKTEKGTLRCGPVSSVEKRKCRLEQLSSQLGSEHGRKMLIVSCHPCGN